MTRTYLSAELLNNQPTHVFRNVKPKLRTVSTDFNSENIHEFV